MNQYKFNSLLIKINSFKINYVRIKAQTIQFNLEYINNSREFRGPLCLLKSPSIYRKVSSNETKLIRIHVLINFFHRKLSLDQRLSNLRSLWINFLSILANFECCFSNIQNVLGTQVKDQKTRRQLTAAGFLVITQR